MIQCRAPRGMLVYSAFALKINLFDMCSLICVHALSIATLPGTPPPTHYPPLDFSKRLIFRNTISQKMCQTHRRKTGDCASLSELPEKRRREEAWSLLNPFWRDCLPPVAPLSAALV